MTLSTAIRPDVPTGVIKSFGEYGPKYEVGELVRRAAGDDWDVEIFLIETGEATEYKLSHINDDPAAV